MKRQAQRELEGPPVDVAGDATEQVAHVIVPPSGVNLAVIESAIIRFALAQHGGNQTHAAQFLHVSRSALLYRMRKYGLDVPTRPDPSHARESLR